jgi:hypothetical protein
MNVLYIAAESDLDADFYKLCAEWITGIGFPDELMETLKVRKRSGVDAVRRLMRDLLLVAKSRAKAGEQVHFIASMDNDRAPHTENEKRLSREALCEEEKERTSRIVWMDEATRKVLGENPAAWAVKMAVAVPVEMIESWIIQILQPEIEPLALPHFSRADSTRAKLYYKRPDPPPQCKDVAASLRERSPGLTDEDYRIQVVMKLDAEALAARSLSFSRFKNDLEQWKGSKSSTLEDS